ncbi:MAG TPA: hypothetical protein VMT26_04915 [Candidatus Bathyarchaeia archaeon]|nr:hypothetical protein [Candidatus Bathyarchaeia archaeon]
MVSQKTMKASTSTITRTTTMTETRQYVKKVQEEFAKFENTMEELRALRSVADELKSFRRMIELKKYD